MTVQQLLNMTLGISGITPANGVSYLDTVVSQVNVLLAQNFDLENNNRLFLGMDELTSIPQVTALTDTIPYLNNIVTRVLVWGLAQLLSLSDDDVVKAGFFENRYGDAIILEGKFVNTDIEDYFGNEAS